MSTRSNRATAEWVAVAIEFAKLVVLVLTLLVGVVLQILVLALALR